MHITRALRVFHLQELSWQKGCASVKKGTISTALTKTVTYATACAQNVLHTRTRPAPSVSMIQEYSTIQTRATAQINTTTMQEQGNACNARLNVPDACRPKIARSASMQRTS